MIRRPYMSTLALLGALLACGPVPEISPPDLDPPPEPLTDDEAAELAALARSVRLHLADGRPMADAATIAFIARAWREAGARLTCDGAIEAIRRADLLEVLRHAADPARAEALLLRARPDLEPEIRDCARALRDESGLALDPGPGDPEAAGGIAAVPADRALLGALELRRDHGAASIVGCEPADPPRAAFVRFGGGS